MNSTHPSKQLEESEAEFHDQWAASVEFTQISVKNLFESGSCPENRQILTWMGDLRGKRILEIGCGLGEASVYFAMKGAITTAVDISPGMLEVTQKLARLHGVEVKTVCASAMNLDAIKDQSFDFVYASNLLHHVEIAPFLTQVKRKLAIGGSAFFWDPVHYNPVIQIYRSMATKVRTPDEHPLKASDIKLMRRNFRHVEMRFFWYLSLVIFLKFFLIDRLNPNQSRYWKKIIDDAPRIGPWLSILHRIDKLIFSWVPGIRWLAWNVVIRCENGQEGFENDK
jgi:2-polyprenyl-3-methyl-5-hydroxy-6-metoxy-1,4-benzoquinol methylase